MSDTLLINIRYSHSSTSHGVPTYQLIKHGYCSIISVSLGLCFVERYLISYTNFMWVNIIIVLCHALSSIFYLRNPFRILFSIHPLVRKAALNKYFPNLHQLCILGQHLPTQLLDTRNYYWKNVKVSPNFGIKYLRTSLNFYTNDCYKTFIEDRPLYYCLLLPSKPQTLILH